jgi:DNA-binding response OmpR family regulator
MRILIVEDEQQIADAIKKFLEKEGYAVDHLADGFQAQQRILLHRNEYDLIILDLMLPGMPGLEICDHVRSEGISIPILILTARDFLNDKVTLLDSGADDYMVKPFSMRELLSRVKALLRRPKQSLPPVLTYGPIQLDTKSRRAYLGKKRLSLTAKEYALLEYFLRHPDEVLDRERILDHLWGFDFDSFSNIVDVHIKNLRKKLDGRRKQNIIETVHGMGYRLRKLD